MGIIILVGLALGYIVLAYFASKTWHVMHVILLVGLFFATVGFSILAAASLKTHSKYRKEYNDLKERLETELEHKEELLNGNPLAGEDAEPAIRVLEGDVKRSLVDRGRVWRHFSVAGLEGNQLTLDASKWGNDQCQKVGIESNEEIEPIADGGAAASIKPLAINTGSIVFAFRETPITEMSQELKTLLFGEASTLAENDTNGLCKLPTYYLGEFMIKTVADDNSTLVLEPIQPMDQQKIELIKTQNFTWVLYEKMPVDAHDIFSGMSTDQLKIILPPTENLNAQTYEAILNEYSRDQQRAEEADLPERKWIKVKFLKTYDVDVDVPEAVPEPNQAFDATGRSQSALLNQSEKTTFHEGDEVMFDIQTATRLQNDGYVETVEPIFVRRLRDYEQAFRFFFIQNESLATEIRLAEEDLASLKQTIDSLQGQKEFRTEEKTKLTQDQQGYDREQQIITAVHQGLKEKWDRLRKELSQLYKINKQLSEQISELRPVSTPNN